MKIDSGKLKRAVIVGAVLLVCLTVLLTFAAIQISGHRIVSKSEYDKSGEILDKYGKLFEMQTMIRKNYLFDVDAVKEQDAMLKGLASGLDDKYSEYLTKEQADKFKNALDRGEEGTVTSKLLKGKAGYIRISSFGEKTAKEFSAELKALENKKARSLVVDLRGNGGGYADQGIEIADLLMPEGTITYMEDRNGKKKYYNSDENRTQLKYALLVDKDTASTSEIIAAAIKDSGSGEIVGEKTYGKGVVQQEFDFDDGSMLKLTVYQYFSPKGQKIDGFGVTPDVAIKDMKKTEKITLKDSVIRKAFDSIA